MVNHFSRTQICFGDAGPHTIPAIRDGSVDRTDEIQEAVLVPMPPQFGVNVHYHSELIHAFNHLTCRDGLR